MLPVSEIYNVIIENESFCIQRVGKSSSQPALKNLENIALILENIQQYQSSFKKTTLEELLKVFSILKKECSGEKIKTICSKIELLMKKLEKGPSSLSSDSLSSEKMFEKDRNPDLISEVLSNKKEIFEIPLEHIVNVENVFKQLEAFIKKYPEILLIEESLAEILSKIDHKEIPEKLIAIKKNIKLEALISCFSNKSPIYAPEFKDLRNFFLYDI